MIDVRPWDAADYLEEEEDVVAYLEAAFEDGDPQLITAALGDIARSRGMTKIASRAGLGRESLYKALSRDGNPALATVLKVIQALGLRLRVTRPLSAPTEQDSGCPSHSHGLDSPHHSNREGEGNS